MDRQARITRHGLPKLLTRLLTIKREREREAIARLGEAQREYDRLHAVCQAKEWELQDFHDWREQEVARLYEAVHLLYPA